MMFGRFQPPTIAHANIINHMWNDSRRCPCESYVFISPKQDNKKNPLSYEYRLEYLQKMKTYVNNPQQHILNDNTIKDPFGAICFLGKLGFEHIIVFTGSDRAEDYESFRKYINHPDPLKCIPNVKEISIVGYERDSESVSATAAREAAKVGDTDTFCSLTFGSLDDKCDLFCKVLEGLDPK